MFGDVVMCRVHSVGVCTVWMSRGGGVALPGSF